MEEHDVRVRFERMKPFLDERGRRLFAANEAMSMGHGGVETVSVATGMARSTIDRGMAELRGGQDEIDGAIRRPGAGRKPEEERQPGLLAALEGLIEGAIRGDPETPLRWVSRSQRHLAKALRGEGFEVSQKLVGPLLKKLKYSCQGNRKTREGSNHPDRNAQFEHINATVKAAMAAGEPAISVDTKKKNWSATSRMAAASCVARAIPSRCGSMTSKSRAWARWRPMVSTTWRPMRAGSMSGSMLILARSRSKASAVGGRGSARHAHPDATSLTITADCGGSNGARVRLWKLELQRFADETGLTIIVAHLPLAPASGTGSSTVSLLTSRKTGVASHWSATRSLSN